MVEIWTSEAMAVFIDNISSFPTLIFTGLMIFVTLYWVVSLLGLVAMDSLDGDFAGETGDVAGSHDGGHFNGHHPQHFDTHHAHHQGEVGFITSILLRFGLQGVPVLVILTLLSLSGWLISYLLMHVVNAWFGTGMGRGLVHYVLAGVVLLVTIWLSLEVTSLIVKPIRKLIKSSPERTANTMLGKVATVRTMSVDAKHGEAVIEEGGATLILKVRAFDESFEMGDKVVLIEYFPNDNSYRVESI